MKKLLTIGVTIVLLLPCAARATPLGSVDMAHTGFGAASLIKLWGGGYDPVNAYAGVYMFNKTGSTGEGNLLSDGLIGAFCIELPENPSGSTVSYDVVMPEESPQPTSFLGDYMGTVKAEYLYELWGRFFDPDWVGSGPFTSDQKENAEAFAAAIWEIVYEDLPLSPADWNVELDGTAGELGFRCANADTSTANDWLHSLNGTGPKANLRALVYDGKQDYIVGFLPEPTTIALLGLGALSLLRRKRRA